MPGAGGRRVQSRVACSPPLPLSVTALVEDPRCGTARTSEQGLDNGGDTVSHPSVQTGLEATGNYPSGNAKKHLRQKVTAKGSGGSVEPISENLWIVWVFGFACVC